MPRVGRPTSVQRQRVMDAVPEMTDVDSDEVMTLEDIAEIRQLFADAIVLNWARKRGIK